MLPFVSILIPIRNEALYIEKCLDAVLRQEYPRDLFEILIADGLSTDGTKEKILKIAEKHPNIFIYDNPQFIVSTGLNKIILNAKGEILIRVDGHCIIEPDYIKNCVRHLTDDEIDAVGGPMRSIGENRISEAIALSMSSKFGVGNSSFRTESGSSKFTDTVPFPAYTRDIIEKVGLYDEELIRNQDDEYNYRIRKAGGKILLADDVNSDYFSRGSFAKLWKQYFQYGFWKVRVFQKHPYQMSIRQFIPITFILTLVFTFISGLIWPRTIVIFYMVCATYILANLIASISTSAQNKWQHVFYLPVCYSILHISYGLGFLKGLVFFRNRWKDTQGKTPAMRY